MNNTPPRSPDEQFEGILLQLTQSAEARASWSPYRALILMLVACLRDIRLALRHLAAHLPEAAQEAAPEAEPEAEAEAGEAAPFPLHPAQATCPREAAEPSAIRPRARPQAAQTAPEAPKPPLPLRGRTAKQTNAGERGRDAGTPKPATSQHSPFHPPKNGPPKISTRDKPAPWHAHNVSISQ